MRISLLARPPFLHSLILFLQFLPLFTSFPLSNTTLRVTVTSCRDWSDIYAPYWNRFPQCHQGTASRECCETYDLLDKSLRIFQEALSCEVTNGRFFADKFQQWCTGSQSPVPDQGSGTSQSPGTPDVGSTAGGHGDGDGIIILDDGTTQITNNSGQSGSTTGGGTSGGGTGGTTGGGGSTGGSGTIGTGSGGTTGGGTSSTGCGPTGCGTGCSTGCSTDCTTGCDPGCSTDCGTGCTTSCGGTGGGHGDASSGGCSLCTNCCQCCGKCCHCTVRSSKSGCSVGVDCGVGSCTPVCQGFNCGECHACESGGSTGGSGGSSSGDSSGGSTGGGSTNNAGGSSGETEHVKFERACFSADGVVELKDGMRKRMDEVEIGDSIHVGGGEYSEVILWTHQSKDVLGRFVVVHADSGVFTMTETHFVYSGRGVLAAKELKVGDVVKRGNGSWVDVEKVAREVRRGLYNPQTVQGDIVVDGFVATTYTTATGNWQCGHGLLTPLRWLYRLGLSVK